MLQDDVAPTDVDGIFEVPDRRLRSPQRALQVPNGLLLDIPPYARTYSASQTRGFWFTAPIDFRIVGLNVPNELNQAVQNVEVFIMDQPPASFPSFSSGGSVFYTNLESAGQVIATDIAVQAGKIVGILGAAGNGSMRNSYASVNNFPSSINGSPVVLTRFGAQQAISSASTVQYFTELSDSTPVSRVEMYYTVVSHLLIVLFAGSIKLYA